MTKEVNKTGLVRIEAGHEKNGEKENSKGRRHDKHSTCYCNSMLRKYFRQFQESTLWSFQNHVYELIAHYCLICFVCGFFIRG